MQVWVDNRLVGNLAVTPRYNDVHTIHQMQQPMSSFSSYNSGIPLQEPQIDRIDLPMRPRQAAFDNLLLDTNRLDLPTMMRAANIPADAEMSRDAAGLKTRFKWRVFDISPAVYEQIFDMREFEPV